MTYELAKQLKDAGFPQKGEIFTTSTGGFCNFKSGGVYIPTLSELIEACGDRFFRLTLNSPQNNRWIAELVNWDETEGFSPEEAVAKLWLELNKK